MATLIKDGQALVSVTTRFGSELPIYDDGFGPLWIHRDSMGISGVVRAQTWSDAYGICEDEFFPEATETVEEIVKDYGFNREHVKIIKRDGVERDCTPEDYPLAQGEFVRWETRQTPAPEAWAENALFQEAFGFRPNGPNKRDTLKHGIYSKDLNGDSLEKLTPKLAQELGLTVTVKDEE